MENENKKIHVKVIVPTRVIYDDDADFIILRAQGGDMGVLYGHEPCSALLDYGMMRIFAEKQETVLTVLGGFATVVNNEVVVLSDMAERPEKLQEALDKVAAERASNLQSERVADLDMHRAETALRRSLVHMDVSSYPIIRGNEDQSD